MSSRAERAGKPCRWKLVAIGVGIGMCVFTAGTSNAQTTIFAEGFNTPGNGTRFTLIRDYYEITQPNNLWTTVPNQLPGENVIVFLEPGDQYIDGTPVPARRATFFADNDLGDATFGIDLTDEGFALFDAAINWATDTDGTTPLTINFVIDDDSDVEVNNLDLTLVDRLLDQGHNVIVTNPDLPPDDFDDLIFMASHDDGSAVGAMAPEFKTTTTPLITGFFHAAAPLGFGSERGENTNGTYNLQIVDSAHPLAAGLPNGIVQVVDDNAVRQRLTRVTRGTIAPDAKVVATLPGAVVSVPDDFINFEGQGYLRGGHSTWNNAPEAGQPRGWQTNEPLDTTVVDNPRLVLDLAASEGIDGAVGPYEGEFDDPENFDFIRVLTDADGDGEFDVLTEFLAADPFDSDFPGFLAAEDGTILNAEFKTLTFDLPTSSTLGLRIDVFTNAGDEVVGIDNLRVIGEGILVPDDCNGDGVISVADANCTPADGLDDFLAANGLLKGDADGDDQVQFSDFVILADNFGNPGQYTDGDFDKDGTVQFGDFVILSENFGQSAAATAAVPEPNTALLMTIGGMTLLRRRRK